MSAQPEGPAFRSYGDIFPNASNFSISGGHFNQVICKVLSFAALNYIDRPQLAYDEQNTVKQWLNAPDYSASFITALNKKVSQTGQWMLEDQEYMDWKNHRNILWIQGKAGSGKTVLS
ncbi:hypothetical protein BT96DRAFT_301526 [Gymnopus androsaceus JB14]|uniref:Nephrocystin 3-like N-terminal domain-containing protein n=1 Tax=Gymnopus androsaceus JB14 TaxID=1447944 RepID=A0A6A4H1U5_9AGAR|nr:hypothetical protein BT96DRAFT_301526 [Gymnopus androsaceus JB14]